MKPNGRYTPPDPPAQRMVTSIRSDEMLAIFGMHDVAQRREIILLCGFCQRPFFGYNNGAHDVLAISCSCRELRAIMRGPHAS